MMRTNGQPLPCVFPVITFQRSQPPLVFQSFLIFPLYESRLFFPCH